MAKIRAHPKKRSLPTGNVTVEKGLISMTVAQLSLPKGNVTVKKGLISMTLAQFTPGGGGRKYQLSDRAKPS